MDVKKSIYVYMLTCVKKGSSGSMPKFSGASIGAAANALKLCQTMTANATTKHKST